MAEADKKNITVKLLVAGPAPDYGVRASGTAQWDGWLRHMLRAPGMIVESIEQRPATQ